MSIEIIQIQENQSQVCDKILRSLPRWFGIEEAIVEYVSGVSQMPTFVAYDKQEAVGFISLKIHNEFSAEIYVMGILESYHRQGIGHNLVLKAQDYLMAHQFKFFSVKTLSPARNCSEYEKTRHFYLSQGFFPIEEFKTLWGEANPCLMLMKSLITSK